MHRAILLCAGLAILAGCGDSSERAYYHTRYIPTSSESAYSASERARWKGDLSVYELPAAAPDLDGEAQTRSLCDKPGPLIKGQTVLGMHGETHATGQADFQPVGGSDKRPVPLGSRSPLSSYVVSGTRGLDVAGVPQDNFYTKVGGWDHRMHTHGSDIRTSVTPGAMRPEDKTNFCLPPETPTVVVPVRR